MVIHAEWMDFVIWFVSEWFERIMKWTVSLIHVHKCIFVEKKKNDDKQWWLENKNEMTLILDSVVHGESSVWVREAVCVCTNSDAKCVRRNFHDHIQHFHHNKPLKREADTTKRRQHNFKNSNEIREDQNTHLGWKHAFYSE